MKNSVLAVIAVLAMVVPGTLQAQTLRGLSAKETKPLEIKKVYRAGKRKERSGGARWRWSGKWVKVDIRNNLDEPTTFKVELIAYNDKKKSVKKFSRFRVDQDEREVDPVTSTIRGRRKGKLWFGFAESFLSVNDIKYYEVKLYHKGRVVDRKTYPKSFLKELLRMEKE